MHMFSRGQPPALQKEWEMGVDITVGRGEKDTAQKLPELFDKFLPPNKVEKARNLWIVSDSKLVELDMNMLLWEILERLMIQFVV